MNRIDRLFAIALLLQSRRVVTAAEISRHFEISVRTVYRDLGALGEAGIPVQAEAGVGYSLTRGYFLPPIAFSAEEAQALALGAVLVASFGGEPAGGAAATALLKIQSILGATTKERLSRLARQVTVLGRRSVPGTDHLVVCASAVAGNRVLQLDYTTNEQKRTTRKIEPLGVVLYQDFWYLVAWCRLRQGLRNFRLDRINQLDVLPELFPVRRDFDLEKHLRREFESFDGRAARFRFSPRVIDRALRELGPCVQSQRNTADTIEVAAFVWSDEWMARWILSFGTDAQVLEPESLRGAVRRELARLQAIYREPSRRSPRTAADPGASERRAPVAAS